MKKITNLYVAEVLRKKKLIHHFLNFKNVSKWNESDYASFQKILNGDTAPTYEPNIKNTSSRKVVRRIDGKIYNSIRDCSNDEMNCISYSSLILILNGKVYKRKDEFYYLD